MRFFKFKKVNRDDTETLRQVYRLRYQVYCEEWGFEQPEDHPDKFESDEFDPYSVHFIAIRRETEEIIGTIRIILNSPMGFPIEKHSQIDHDQSSIIKDEVGEISRLAVSKEYSRRTEDKVLHDGKSIIDFPEMHLSAEERRERDNEIVTGLYRCVATNSADLGLKHWYAVMARGLYLLLKRRGILFDPVGPEVEYHGLRRPYIVEIDNVRKNVPELFVPF